MQATRKRTDPEAFVRALAPALRQSASIARALEGRVANRPKAGETTAVKAALTIADTASQEALLVPLLEHFPTVRLAAEEDTPSTIHFASAGPELVVIDPIDGTLRFYLEGAGPYAVMIGLAREREYTAALVALPREELYLDAVRGQGARVAQRGSPPRRGARRGDRQARLRLAQCAGSGPREPAAGAASRWRRPAAVRSPSRRSCPEPAPACASPRSPSRISRSAGASVC